jgi:phage gpG-like protein
MAVAPGSIGSRALIGGAGSVRAVAVSFDFEPSIGVLANQMQKFGLEFEHLREPLFLSISKVMIPSFRANFAAEGRPPWDELSVETAKRRGASHPILRRTGRLEKDATSTKRWYITDTGAAIKDWPSSSWYGRLHQAGYGMASKASVAKQTSRSAAKTVIPARPFIMFQEEDPEKIQAIFMEWMTAKAAAYGWLR